MEQLKTLRKSLKYTQKNVADYLGIDRTTYVKYENGQSEPNFETLLKICELFQVSTDYLLGSSSSDTTTVPPTGENWVPVLGRVRAGVPIDAVEEILDYEQLDAATARRGKHIGLKVVGDSMEPRFAAGDVVIVRLQPDIDSGEIGIVLVNGDEATIKRVIKQDDGIMLVATNPAYPPRFFSKKEMTTLPVTILGKVIELRAKF